MVRKRFATATKNLALEELLLPATDQNEIGNAINRQKKATTPRRMTGSKEEIFKRESSIDIKIRSFLKKTSSFACLF